MKRKLFLGMFFMGITLLLTCAGAEADTQERESIKVGAGAEAGIWEREDIKEPTYVPGEILVRWKDWANESSIRLMHSTREATVVSTFYATHKRERIIQQVRIREGQTVEEALQEYRRDPLVEHAQPNYLYHFQTIPDDLRFGELWGLHNTGQTVGGVRGTFDADIDAPEAWGITTGSAEVIIAVIDTGVNYLHPELAGNMWVNPGEIAGDEIDNDGNTFIDDIHGWDFFDNDNSPMDFHTHGTHVAGTIAAMGNNAAGITGVMWDAQIMALKIGGVKAFGALGDIIPAINYAVAEGAHIINASWGRVGDRATDTPGRSILRDVIEAAGHAGVLFVAAAGNDGTNNDTTPFFPASYTLSNIISVAATDHNDALAGFSNSGATSVDIAAPGVSILSTIPTFSYGPPVTLYDSTGFEGDTVGALPSGWVNIGLNNIWAINNLYFVSPPHSFEDSPGVDYANNLVSTETLTYLNTKITHIRDNRYWFTFDIRYDLEAHFDFLDVVFSSDAATWHIYDGITDSSGGAFVPVADDFTELVEFFRGVYLGFGIDSNTSITGVGVYIDNLSIVRKPIIVDAYDPALSYRHTDGTSMSAPHVAGLAGLILSLNPTLIYAEVKDIILGSVDILPPLVGKTVTGGRINAHTALLATPPALIGIAVTPATVAVVFGATQTFTAAPIPANAVLGTVAWSVPAGVASTIHTGTGVFTAGTVTETVMVIAIYAGISGTATATVVAPPPPPPPPPPPDPGICFIATAAYGTPLAEEVEVLRRFRDRYLLTNELGRRFVSFYYEHSPALAERISNNKQLKSLVRIGLKPLLWFSQFMTED